MKIFKSGTALKTTLVFLLLLIPGFIIRHLTMCVPFFTSADGDWAVFGKQAWDIVCGHWSFFRYGQHYLGTFPLLVDVLNFALLGPTHRALFLGSMYFWVAYEVSLYFLAKTIYDRKVALAAVFFGSLSTVFSLYLSCEPSRGYLDTMIMGNILFTLFIKFLTNPKTSSNTAWMWFGLVSGLCFWTSFLSAYYFIPIILLALWQKPRLLRSPRMLTAGFFFILGSLPFWIYNIVSSQPFSSFSILGGTGHVEYTDNILLFFNKLRMLLGLYFDHPAEDILSVPGLLFFALAAAVVSFDAFSKKQANAQTKTGARMLILFCITVFLLGITSAKYSGRGNGHRYIMPLYTMFYIAAAALCSKAAAKRKYLFYSGIGFVAALNLTNQFMHNPKLDAKQRSLYCSAFEDLDRDFEKLFNKLEYLKHPITAVECDNMVGSVMEFWAVDHALKFTHPQTTQVPEKSLLLDLQQNYVRLDKNSGFNKTLQSLLINPEHQTFAGYTLYYNLEKTNLNYQLLDNDQINITASQNPQKVSNITDRRINSGWSATDPAWIELEILPSTPLARLILCSNTNPSGVPAGILVEGSNNRIDWEYLNMYCASPGTLCFDGRLVERPGEPVVEIDLPSDSFFRYVRIKTPEPFNWAVDELFAFCANKKQNSPHGYKTRIVEFLKQHKVTRAYADDLISAVILRDSDIKCFNEYRWKGFSRKQEYFRHTLQSNKMLIKAGTAIVVANSMAPLSKKLLEQNGVEFTSHEILGHTVFIIQKDSNAHLMWLRFGFVQYWSQADSSAFYNQAVTQLKKGSQPLAKQLLRQAMEIYPYNVDAAKTICGEGLFAPSAPIYEQAKKLLPLQQTDIEFKNGLKVTGYSLHRLDKDNALIRIFAQPDARQQAHLQPHIFGLDKAGTVKLTKVIPAVPGTMPEWNKAKNITVMFEQHIKLDQNPETFWLCFVDSQGKRQKIKSVEGEKFAGTRIELKDIL